MNSYLYSLAVNVSITTGNFLTTNYCQVINVFSQKNMYAYFSKVNITIFL